ncbi:signal transduction histidine kinase [Diaminobutyricimonas aerilata]|uniref:histidine kinase n=1 Tax=Diaminobutyricimonas aerilata TaxID=1162967 RepID=A0A2M9CHN3_9MICO|nr:histidine kinase [Diaminobutyricimonas aerilata]PJJ71365.1 signal transduction histidine kinase [Diaminobutyricimonas aerilata]
MRRLFTRENTPAFVVGAVVLIAVMVESTTILSSATDQKILLVIAVTLPLSLRPLPTWSLALAAGLVLAAVYGPGASSSEWAFVVAAVTSFFVGRIAESARAVLVASGAVLVVAFALSGASGTLLSLFVTAVLALTFACVVPWWLGAFLRQRRQLVEAGWMRARLLEERQQLAVRQAREHERTSIARDMHDSLGHELSLLALTAGALEVATGTDDETRRRAALVRERAVAGMETLHRIVDVLRSNGDDESRDVRPLEELIAEAARSGLAVRAEVRADASGWRPATARTVERLVQELLANAARHAPGRTLDLRIDEADGAVRIVARNPVADPARADTDPRRGYGLIGMRERVRVAGGTFAAGVEDAEFVVSATVPEHRPPGRDDSTESFHPTVRTADEERHGMRRAHLRTALLPAVLVLAVGVALAVFDATTTSQVGLSERAFSELRIGQSRSEAAALLPADHIDRAPAHAPAPPRGASCEYYRAVRQPFSLDDSLYRLCFRDEVLVVKETL